MKQFGFAWPNLLSLDWLRVVRFFLAGVLVATGYTLTVVVFVEWLGWSSPALASAASFVIWTPVSYFAHRTFTFRFKGAYYAPSAKFLIVFLLRLAASALVVAVVIEWLGWHYIVGVFFNWVILPLINYVALHRWVFSQDGEAELALPAEK